MFQRINVGIVSTMAVAGLMLGSAALPTDPGGHMMATGTPAAQPGGPFSGHTEDITSLAFSPDGKILASGSCGQHELRPDNTVLGYINFCLQGEIRLWDSATGQPIGQPLAGHSGTVTTLAFTPDGKTLFSIGDDKTLLAWSVGPTPAEKHIPLAATSSITSLALSPDGKRIATANTAITLQDIATGSPTGAALVGQGQPITSLAFSPDGKLLASADNNIRFWNLATGKQDGQPLTGHSLPVTSMAFSPDGKFLASVSRETTVWLWNVATRQSVGQEPQTGIIPDNKAHTVAFSADGKTLVFFHGLGIGLWDLASGKRTIHPLNFQAPPQSVALSHDLKIMATGACGGRKNLPQAQSYCIAGAILLWDVTTGQAINIPGAPKP